MRDAREHASQIELAQQTVVCGDSYQLTLSKLKKTICALRYVVTGIPVFIYAIAGYSKSSHRGAFGDRDRDHAPAVVCRLSPFL